LLYLFRVLQKSNGESSAPINQFVARVLERYDVIIHFEYSKSLREI
jgi:hypothetical protein